MTVLLSALSLAGAATQPVGEQAVMDGYAALKALLVRRHGPKSPKLERTLADHAEDPETYRAPMEKVLKEVGADRDQEILDAAAELLKRAEAAQPGITGGVVGQLNAQGGRIVVIGGEPGGSIYLGDAGSAEEPPISERLPGNPTIDPPPPPPRPGPRPGTR